MGNLETAVFGGGCFWCTEAIFKSLKGVESVMPGYAGRPPAEVIRIVFDPTVIAYSDLLEVFWHVHNPTTLNRQGNDTGPEYRSIILSINEKQKKFAEESLEKLAQAKDYEDAIVTEIKPFDKFTEAEDYHKNFYDNHKDELYCQVIISPKLNKLRQKYKSLVR